METLVQRLVANPHDAEALEYAHRAGMADPRSYAVLLEKVGQASTDPAYAAHWLSEAANVWSTTIGDAHHAARTLMAAIEKDPTARSASERLAQLYRGKGDLKALVALLERVVKSLAPHVNEPEVRERLAAMHEELGRLWSEPPFTRADRALENWRKVAELAPTNAYAIYVTREMLKGAQQWADAVPYFGMEQAIVDDPERKVALYRDEADVRRRAGDVAGATQALRSARALRPEDLPLKQEVGAAILERIDAGERVAQPERDEAAQLFVSLAETYDGEYGLSYSVSALKGQPGNDRAMQLADFYAAALNRTAEIGPQYAAYLHVNPNGFMAEAARAKVGSARPPPPPLPPHHEARAMRASQPAVAHANASHANASHANAHANASHTNASHSNVSPLAAISGAAAPVESSRAHRTEGSAPGVPMPSQGPEAHARTGRSDAPPAPSAPVVPSQPAAPAAPPLSELQALLDDGQSEAQKGRKPQAYAKYRDALKIEPAHPEALSWVEDYLRQKRMYADLRDVLLAASRVPGVSQETRTAQLREVAGICESQLRDVDTAIQAWKQVCQIDRADEHAREQLRRLLEKSARWDELVTLLEQEAMATSDLEEKIAAEKKLATLHETKRNDPVGAAEAWARIANLAPEDETAIQTAVRLYETGERFDLAAQVLTDTVRGIEDDGTRSALFQKLGELLTKTGDAGGAGEAYTQAALVGGGVWSRPELWELAEKAFLTANRFADAANAVDQRAQSADGKAKAALLAQAADLLLKANDPAGAIGKLEEAAEIDPTSDTYARALEEQYRKEGREAELVRYLGARADKLPDKARRVAVRRAAADLSRSLGDAEGARESLLALLNDGEDAEALGKLVEDATTRGEHEDAVDFLRRLGALAETPAAKLEFALREGGMLARDLNDVEGALARYEAILHDLDPKNRQALHAIAEIHEERDDMPGVAAALERELPLADGDEKVGLAQRLAQLYEGPLADPRRAIRALEVVHAADPEDFDAIARLEKLSEEIQDWPRVAALMQTLIDVEGDEEEAARLTLRLSEILERELGRGDEALSTLERLADQGDEQCREAYVALGDKLGWKGIVATKLVAWHEGGTGPSRIEALRSAFRRFLEIGRDQDAARVAIEIARARAADHDLAEELERIATRLHDLDALGVAHDILSKELSGVPRAAELVRQAEVQIAAGIDPLEATQHGESGLSGVPASEVEPLLTRLAALAPAPNHVIDLYERQVGRCRAPADRLAALARAAQIAAERGANERARSFFELALSGGVQEETLGQLEAAARLGDDRAGGSGLLSTLAEALAAGGHGSRDGGRTRSALLRRAATIAHRDLDDVDKAFRWLGDALITHVDDASLDALDALGREIDSIPRVEATLSRALEEVFDGPLVRKLLQRRARLRRDVLGDEKGAAVDLKKLHDLSPSDADVMNELSGLLLQLGDHRGMIQLYEDQILRGRDPAQRAELARKVAHLWEEELGDAREAADAWRRVLRMKAGDPEATTGLERAKSGKLKRKPPPVLSSPPPPPSPSTPPPVSPSPRGSSVPPPLSPRESAPSAPAEGPPLVEAQPTYPDLAPAAEPPAADDRANEHANAAAPETNHAEAASGADARNHEASLTRGPQATPHPGPAEPGPAPIDHEATPPQHDIHDEPTAHEPAETHEEAAHHQAAHHEAAHHEAAHHEAAHDEDDDVAEVDEDELLDEETGDHLSAPEQ